jgi:hypothetical protein
MGHKQIFDNKRTFIITEGKFLNDVEYVDRVNVAESEGQSYNQRL